MPPCFYSGVRRGGGLGGGHKAGRSGPGHAADSETGQRLLYLFSLNRLNPDRNSCTADTPLAFAWHS
jgi:hypothetical protein